MPFALATFAFALLQALGMHANIVARDGLIKRPQFVCKAIAARLRAGVRALGAYLRRILVLMALEIEHELVAAERPENLARAKAKKARIKTYGLRIYPAENRARDTEFAFNCFQNCRTKTVTFDATHPPVTVPIERWLDRLNHLYALANDPRAKARRLAYTLARSRHGLLMAPDEPPRKLHRWSREASALYDAMAFQIMSKSQARPPPLPPPRRGLKPTITVFW